MTQFTEQCSIDKSQGIRATPERMGNVLNMCSRQSSRDQVIELEMEKSRTHFQMPDHLRGSCEDVEDFQWPNVVLSSRPPGSELFGADNDQDQTEVVEVRPESPQIATKPAKSPSKKKSSWLDSFRVKARSESALGSRAGSQALSSTDGRTSRSHPSMAWSYHCSRGARAGHEFRPDEGSPLPRQDPDATEAAEQPTDSYDAGRGLLELLRIRVDMAANNMEINGILKRLDEMSNKTRKRLQSLKRRLNVVTPSPTERPIDAPTPPSRPIICWE